MHTPEVVRVYIGSFWKQPLQHTSNRSLFELEHEDLLKDLQCLPRQNSVRKLNDFIRRSRLAKVSCWTGNDGALTYLGESLWEFLIIW